MIERLQQAAGRLMNRVRVNHVQAAVRDGAPVVVKRRRAGTQVIIWVGNRLLALAQSGARMFVRADDWIDWEIHCAQLLYPGRPRVIVEPGAVVILPRVEGTSLRAMLLRNDPEIPMALTLGARELRRAHHLYCERYEAGWSHGDLHLDNILCDVKGQRAVLIDFDMRHELRLDVTRRQSEDVKVVLVELTGLPDDRWREWATVFVEEYREASVLNALAGQLEAPRGCARLLWYIRTNGAPVQRSEPRLPGLRSIIEAVTRGDHD